MCIGSDHPSPHGAASSDREWMVTPNEVNWIDLTVNDHLANPGVGSGSFGQLPSPLASTPSMIPATPHRPTIPQDPTFTVASSDNDDGLDDPWAEDRKFSFL